MAKGKAESKSKDSSTKTVTGPSGETRVRGTKAGKGRNYLPAGHPERSHDGAHYRRREKKVALGMQEWIDRRGRGIKRKSENGNDKKNQEASRDD